MKVRMTVVGIVAALAVALVPPALGIDPGDAHDRQGTVATVQDAHDRYTPTTQPTGVVGDSHERSNPVTDRPTLVLADGGFDWADATIGALTGMGLALVLGGLAFLTLGRSTRVAVR